MVIKTNAVLVDLKGNELKQGPDNFTVGEALGLILTNAQEQGKFKLYTLAKKFTTDESVDLDVADLALVKRLVEADKSLNTLVDGQLLDILEGLEK